MELSYKQLEKTLTSHLRILPDREATFRSRIKQLQRLEFPGGVNVGRGTKMVYTGEHLFKLITVFELLQLGLPALAATTFVERHWPQFSAAYALTALDRRWPRQKREDIRLFARLTIRALNELQFSGSSITVSETDVHVLDEARLLWSFKATVKNGPFIRPTLAASDLFDKVMNLATTGAGVSATVYDEEFHGWLPKGRDYNFDIESHYPDRSNLAMRKEMHARFGNDPEALTPEGQLEANEFIANNYSSDPPF